MIAQDDFASLRSSFPEVFRSEISLVPCTPANHCIYHFIWKSGPSVYSRLCCLAPNKLAAAKKMFTNMEALGLCQNASSPWSSPLHIVTKKDGTLRPCGDYRQLNMMTEPDHYPLSNIADVTTYLHGAKVFSKLDLLEGYYQVSMNAADNPKTNITTPFGTYTFNYPCFSLRNLWATFQWMMDNVLGDLPFCIAYVDDILIFSLTADEHKHHIHRVLERLHSTGPIVRQEKCVFGAKSVEFLEHHISSKGVLPLQEKVAAVKSFPAPTSLKSLREFIGMVNYYHCFLLNIASAMASLYTIPAGKAKMLTWGPAQAAGFITAKHALSSAAYLKFFRCLVFP